MSLILFSNIYGQVKLIPTPQLVEIKNSGFEINNNTKIVVHDLNSFYSEQLVDCVKQDMGIDLKQVKKAKSNYIEFVKTSTEKDFRSEERRVGERV